MCGKINELYSIFFISTDNTCFSLFRMPIFWEQAFETVAMWVFFQFKFASSIKPKKLNYLTRSIIIFFFSEHILVRTSLPRCHCEIDARSSATLLVAVIVPNICDVFLPSLSWLSSASFPGYHSLHYRRL